MDRIINLKPIGHTLSEQTLDDLWHEAEQLGDIKVDRGWGGAKAYQVKIHFRLPSGSTVWATGEHSDIVVAMGRAIDEARRLGPVEGVEHGD